MKRIVSRQTIQPITITHTRQGNKLTIVVTYIQYECFVGVRTYIKGGSMQPVPHDILVRFDSVLKQRNVSQSYVQNILIRKLGRSKCARFIGQGGC